MKHPRPASIAMLLLSVSGYLMVMEAVSVPLTSEWTNMNPSVKPSAREYHAMAYDSQSDRIILFGGTDSITTVSDETWAYDFNTNTWSSMNPSVKPSARNAAMAYDTQSDRVILFGGSGSDETWAYDFNTNTWTNIDPASTPGSFSYGNALAYDSQSDRMILFGGINDAGITSDQTWVYDFNTNTWTRINASVKPASRYVHAMAYDSQSDRIILFGGAAVGAPGLLLLNDETWVYGPPLTLPGAPLNPQKVPGDRRIVLSWQSPSSNGGVPIINYRIFRGTASGSLSFLTELGNVLGYTDTGLTNGVTYYYQVSAKNLIGEGPRSSQISATPVTLQPVPPLPTPWWQQYWYLILIVVAAAVTSGVLVLRKLRKEKIGFRSG